MYSSATLKQVKEILARLDYLIMEERELQHRCHQMRLANRAVVNWWPSGSVSVAGPNEIARVVEAGIKEWLPRPDQPLGKPGTPYYRLRYFKTQKIDFAADLRKTLTPAERCLMDHLHGAELTCRFHPQDIVRGYIVDFYFRGRKLAIEVDGKIHNQRRQQDQARDQNLAKHGILTLRFTNQQVIENPGLVVWRIQKVLSERWYLDSNRGRDKSEVGVAKKKKSVKKALNANPQIPTSKERHSSSDPFI